jgi:hypothetical protein
MWILKWISDKQGEHSYGSEQAPVAGYQTYMEENR